MIHKKSRNVCHISPYHRNTWPNSPLSIAMKCSKNSSFLHTHHIHKHTHTHSHHGMTNIRNCTLVKYLRKIRYYTHCVNGKQHRVYIYYYDSAFAIVNILSFLFEWIAANDEPDASMHRPLHCIALHFQMLWHLILINN